MNKILNDIENIINDDDDNDDERDKQIKKSSNAFFLVCNKYIHDDGITPDELKECLSNLNSDNDISTYGLDKVSSWYQHSNYYQLFQLLDLNKDNIISLQEYQYILDINYSDISNDETVIMKTRDGKTREITRQEMFNIINNQQDNNNDITHDNNNNIYKNIQKSGSIEDIAKENPDVARFIAIGRWIQDELTKIDIYCDVIHMRSLPIGGTIINNENINNTMNNFIDNNDYDIWIEMTVQYNYTNTNNNSNENINNIMKHKNNNKKKTKTKKKMMMRKFEFHIVKDKTKYIRPYLGIVGAWILDSNNSRISNFTIPQLVFNTTTNNINNNTTTNILSYINTSTIIVISIIYFILLLVIVSFIRKNITNDNKDNNNDNDNNDSKKKK